MIELLSKLKDQCHAESIRVFSSKLVGESIKLSCGYRNQSRLSLNAFITKNGDMYEVKTVGFDGKEKSTRQVCEADIVPEIKKDLIPVDEVVEINEEPLAEEDKELEDEITIQVDDNTYDTRVVTHNSHRNSRYAYSLKYGKMGKITDVKVINRKR